MRSKLYVKLSDGKIEIMPIFTDGICNMSPDRASWRRDNGYFPLAPTPPKPRKIPPPGVDWVLGPYMERDGVIGKEWEQKSVPGTVKTFKRSFLAQWLYSHNAWNAFKELLKRSDSLEFFWETSTEFDDTNPRWPEMAGYVSAALGLSDSEYESMLYYGMTGRDIEEDSNDSNDFND